MALHKTLVNRAFAVTIASFICFVFGAVLWNCGFDSSIHYTRVIFVYITLSLSALAHFFKFYYIHSEGCKIQSTKKRMLWFGHKVILILLYLQNVWVLFVQISIQFAWTFKISILAFEMKFCQVVQQQNTMHKYS